VPDWIGWITLGAVGIPTAELPFVNEGNLHEDGNTGSSESGFDNQLLFTDVEGLSIFLVYRTTVQETLGSAPLEVDSPTAPS
jgi:hypothetical protein